MRAEYICPVLTAFDENGKVDMEAMKRQFDHLIEGGLNGIAIMRASHIGSSYPLIETNKPFCTL